jgi:hypothetical protein
MLFVRNANGEIRGAPEDVHQGEGEQHLQTMIAVSVHDEG